MLTRAAVLASTLTIAGAALAQGINDNRPAPLQIKCSNRQELRQALLNQDFVLAYTGVLGDSSEGPVLSAEFWVRWQTGDWGLFSISIHDPVMMCTTALGEKLHAEMPELMP